jgi:hypothetical protein
VPRSVCIEHSSKPVSAGGARVATVCMRKGIVALLVEGSECRTPGGFRLDLLGLEAVVVVFTPHGCDEIPAHDVVGTGHLGSIRW